MATSARVVLVIGLCLAAAGLIHAQEQARPAELVVAEGARGFDLDPLHVFTSLESQLFTALYEGLIVANPVTLEPMPGVASRWEVQDGGKLYKFFLRPDAVFSNGDPVRASDFVASWLRILDPAAHAEYSFLFDPIKGAKAYRNGQLKDPSKVGIRAVNDRLLEVDLEKPAAHFLKLLAHISFVVLHRSLVSSNGWGGNATVIVNGPFTIASRTAGELVLKKNPAYWDAANVALDTIRILFISDPAKATRDYLAGKIDWSTTGNYEQVKDSTKVAVFPMFATSYFYFLCNTAPWSDWKVRRGLALLLPWDEIRSKDVVFADSHLIPTIPAYPEVKSIAAFNRDEGLTLLKEAGFPGGKGLPSLVIKVVSSPESESFGSETARKFAAAWKDAVGLDTVIRTYDTSEEYFTEMKKDDFALGISTWIGDYADPLTFMQLWTSDSNLNDAHFSDPEYDKAVVDSLSILDSRERYKRLGAAEEILLTKAVVLPLNHTPAFHLIDLSRIDGWAPNPLDIHPFKFIRFKAHRAPPGTAMARPQGALPG
jgi:oligopeptide transport system substrate-binding protein